MPELSQSANQAPFSLTLSEPFPFSALSERPSVNGQNLIYILYLES
jgi:hypothetical protein